MDCKVCGSNDVLKLFYTRDYFSGEIFTVYRCPGCGIAFTWPQPTVLDPYYPSAYRSYGTLVRHLLRALYRLRVRKWVRRLGRKGLALEIGFGAGWMLEVLRDHGWLVVGTERTPEAASFAAHALGLPVYVGGLEALRPEPRFDLVLLFHVLEHLPDPLNALRNVSHLLKPGGNLIAAVPNMASWQARLAGPHWQHLDVPRHLFHFTPESLSHLLTLVGLKVTKVRFISWEHDPGGWLQSALNRLGFQQNILNQWLMGINRGELRRLSGFGICGVSPFLFIPCILLSVLSWWARTGALAEVWAGKEAEPCGGNAGNHSRTPADEGNVEKGPSNHLSRLR
ncbi:MAG: class I SAM-dependent methyltransferase [Nitrospinota bacterium]